MPFLTGRRKMGSRAEPMQQIENMDIGAGSGSSAISGAKIVMKRAKTLHIPQAVVVSCVGKNFGVAR